MQNEILFSIFQLVKYCMYYLETFCITRSIVNKKL